MAHTVTRRLGARVNWPPNLGVDWPPNWPPRCNMFYYIDIVDVSYCRKTK